MLIGWYMVVWGDVSNVYTIFFSLSFTAVFLCPCGLFLWLHWIGYASLKKAKLNHLDTIPSYIWYSAPVRHLQWGKNYQLHFQWAKVFFIPPSFLVADTQLYKRLCLSVGRSVGPTRSSWKVGKRAFPPLPTRSQLVAVYPALFSNFFSFSLSSSLFFVLSLPKNLW